MDNNAFTEFNRFLTTTPGGQLLLNLAASYAFQLLEQGRGWVTAQALGKPAQRGLHGAAQIAFAALLHEARKSYPHNRDAHEEAVGAALQRLLAQPGVADRLLGDALTYAELDLPWLEAQFGASGAAERLTAISFDIPRCFKAWHGALAAALQQAAAGNTALFPPWMVANAVAVRDKLDAIDKTTARIETATARIEEKLDQLAPKSTRLPERWRVPFLHNEQFVGREQDLVDLHAALQGGMAVGIRPAGLTGLGGIGKTQLAVEYCYRFRDAYPGGVFWINAAGEWLNAFADLGLFLDDELYGKALDRQARAAAEYFTAHPDSLLVLDNVMDPAQLRVPVTPDLAPAALPCRVVFTTRRRDLGSGFQPVEVSVLPKAPGLRLLLRYPTRQPALDPSHPEHDAATEIYAMLGGLPLALEIAGAHLGKLADKPIASYRDELLKRGALAVVDDPKGKVKNVDLGTRHAAAVEATLAEQWASLQSEDARLLLRVAGQFPEAEVIPAARLGLLAGVSDHDEGFFGAPLALALDELYDTALIERLAGNSIRLHPLVSEFAASRTAPADTAAFRGQCAASMLAAYRNFAILEDHCARRGVEAIEADLFASLAVAQHNSDLQSQISRLLQMLQRESHTLRGWDAVSQPAVFVQQWLKRALIEDEGDTMPAQWRTGALAAPRLATRWLTACTSPALERTLVGHNAEVSAVTVTMDGQRVISGASDGLLKVRNLETGKEERTLTGQGSEIRAIVVTPDGQWMISTSYYDRTLKMWGLTTGSLEQTLTGHRDWLQAVTVTPDGRRAISGSADCTLKIWDLATGVEEHTLIGHRDGVTAVAVSPDCRHAFSVSEDGTLKVWDLVMGTEERTLSENAAWEFVMTVMPDGRHMVTASYGGEITIWDLVTGAADHSLSMYGLGTRLLSVAVLPDGQRVISAWDDGTLGIWDLTTEYREHILIGHSDRVNAVAVTPDGRRVISASSDETLKVWDLATGTEERTLTGHRSDVFTVMVMPDGGQVISASADGTLKVWDLVTGDEGRTLTGHRSGVLAVAATPDGRRVISASHDCTLKVWDLATGQLLSSIALDAPVECVAVAPDGATFFAGDRMGDVYCLCYVETATDSGKERI